MRRPLASRDTAWAKRASSELVQRQITPNQISLGSVAFAALGGFFFAMTVGGVAGAITLLLAAACVQLRLLCNLLDGMVAVEGGQGEPDGRFWNEAPDRAADLLLFAGAGYAAGVPALGWLCAALAIGIAYLRELGRAEGLGADFSGPMAKPHRMAALTVAAIIAMVWRDALWIGLLLIALGCLATIALRSATIIRGLRARTMTEWLERGETGQDEKTDDLWNRLGS